MSAWRQQAFERLPEFRTQLQEAKNPYAYWIELHLRFKDACRNGNLDLFARILDYAEWCMNQPRGKTAEDDLPTCVHVCFVEHVVPANGWRGKLAEHPELEAVRQRMVEKKKPRLRDYRNS
jgi:hypothetical protein